MKKKFFLLVILFGLIIKLCAQNFSLDGTYPFQEESLLSTMTINGQDFIIKFENPPIEKDNLMLKNTIIHIDGMSFLEISKKMPMEIAEWYVFDKSDFVQTSNKILFLAFKKQNNVIMFAFTEGYSFKHSPLTATRYDEWGSLYKDCSSCLVEKSNTYSVTNLSKLVVDTPWVEGVKGDGIGEGFTIECNSQKEPLGPYLFIMNGYISYNKPYLYKQNNRVKQLKVTGLKSGKTKVLNVLDTPHPQTLDISFITEAEDIRIEIADVYKGTKYDDTCLHYCISFDEEVIPYENSIAE